MSKIKLNKLWNNLTPIHYQAIGVTAVAVLVLVGVILSISQLRQRTSPIRDVSTANTTIRLKITDHNSSSAVLKNTFVNPPDQPDYGGPDVIFLPRNNQQGTDLLRFEGSLEYYKNGGGSIGSGGL